MTPAPSPDPHALRSRTDFGIALTDLRERAGLTVRDVARATGLSASTVGDYFSGRHLPPLRPAAVLRQVLGACEVTDEALLTSWDDALRRLRRTPGPRPADSPAPYRGLEAFGVEDAPWFFGRDREVTATLAALERVAGRTHGYVPRMVAVVGASGSGKSSLLRAGVMSRLQSEGVPTALLVPGEHPLRDLHAIPPTGVLIVDQCEEVFGTVDAEQRATFLATLGARARSDGGERVVIGLRADFYRQAIAEPDLRHALQDAQVVLAPMSPDRLREAVVEPALRAGGQVEDGLVELLLAESDAGGDAGALPLLSHVLATLWQQRTRLTVADYRAAGGLRGAVAETAEHAWRELTPEQQDGARRLFLRLVTLGDTTPDTRRHADLAELDPALHPVLDVFVRHRLLTVDANGVQMTHEVVLRAWPRLHAWVDADRAGLRERRHTTEAARIWQSLDRDPSTLLRGARLEAAAGALTDPDADLTEVERAFLQAGLDAHHAQHRHERLQQTRLRVLAATLAVLLVIAIALAAWTADLSAASRRDRDLALSRQVAAASQRVRATDTSLAAQLALVAYRTAPTAEARAALLDTSAGAVARRHLGPRGVLQAIARTGDGRLMAGGSESGTIRLWSTGRSAARTSAPATVTDVPHPGGGTVFAVALTPDGAVLAAGGTGGVRLWDVRDPTHPVLLPPLPDAPTSTVYALAVEPGGTRLVAAGTGGVLRRWDVTDPRAPRALPAPHLDPATAVHALAVSPDGHTLAAGSADGVTRAWTLPGPATTTDATSTGTPAVTAPDIAGATVLALAWSPDGHTLAAGSADKRILLWTTAPGALTHAATVTGPTGWVNAVAFSPDGRRLAAGASDSTLWQWDTTDLRVAARYPHPGPVTAVTYTPDGALVTAAADGAARVWPAVAPRLGVAGKHYAVTFSADGHLLGAGAGANEAALVDARDPAHPRLTAPPLVGPGGAARLAGAAALTRDGHTLATGGADGSILLWDTTDPAHPARRGDPFAADGAVAEVLAFSPDGRTLAAAGDDTTVRLFDVTDPAHPHLRGTPLSGGGLLFGLAYSPDGRRLAAGGADHRIRQWDVTDPAAPRPLDPVLTDAQGYVWGLAYSPDGHLLAAGSADRSVWVWDVTSRSHPTVRAHLAEATNYVYAVAFSPDGRTLAAASADTTVRLWQVPPGPGPFTRLATLTAAGDEALAIAFSPDGAGLVAGTDTGLVEWQVSADGVARSVCAASGEAISRDEWGLYLPGRHYAPPCRAG